MDCALADGNTISRYAVDPGSVVGTLDPGYPPPEKPMKPDRLPDKLPWDELPPDAMDELVQVYLVAGRKYKPRNWEMGMRWGLLFGAMMRHAWAWWRGQERDPDDGKHHLAAVAWCALALISYEKRKMGDDDRAIIR
jgi:hypothetical protein